MSKFISDISNVGWRFDNSYISLPNILMTKINPVKVKAPQVVILNHDLAKDLNLDFNYINEDKLASFFSGNELPKGAECIAQAYAGHQFGYFTMLGDGRSILLGEHINSKNIRFDIQFKGSGKTPYSRNGDGKSALGPMLREYLISEAMYGLAIPTTRSLAVVTTGEEVMRERNLQGAILTRVASSHIRVGTFQYLTMKGDITTLKKLVNYTINRHYSNVTKKENPAITLLEGLIEKQISLIVNWMRVGFIHGVMNTDNVALSGETIDYGPCAFMDFYNPKTVFSSIDHQGRYSFANQEIICHWNVSRFAETLIPLLADNENKAIKIGSKIINKFSDKFKYKWISMMKNKLGFIGNFPKDEIFIKKILSWMEENKADYTNTFIFLMNPSFSEEDIYKNKSFIDLYEEWKIRINKNKVSKKTHLNIMKINNPLLIPRNHIVEESLINVCENNDYNNFNELVNIVKKPYANNEIKQYYQSLPDSNFLNSYKTFCGT